MCSKTHKRYQNHTGWKGKGEGFANLKHVCVNENATFFTIFANTMVSMHVCVWECANLLTLMLEQRMSAYLDAFVNRIAAANSISPESSSICCQMLVILFFFEDEEEEQKKNFPYPLYMWVSMYICMCVWYVSMAYVWKKCWKQMGPARGIECHSTIGIRLCQLWPERG